MKRILTAVSAALLLACTPQTYGPVPTGAQLEWQDMEYYMFCHFGPNTFTDKEWGDGTEDPDVFNPDSLDCDQWAATAEAAGMKGIIITAKHHDGFCLWPSAYSNHTVARSSWRGGRGDVLAELSEACRAHGLKFGIYISPWDRNHPAYGTPEYNEVFAGTVREAHEKYGPVFEQWFDGACKPKPGQRKMPYDWNLFNSTVRAVSPDAVIFSDVGPDCRWVGNEKGYVGETNWCRLDVEGFAPGLEAPDRDTLNSGNVHGACWIPAECDVSIRPGWFYSPGTDDRIKSVDELMEIWFASVGRGANLILNVPPDRTGRINAADSLRLMEFRAARESYFTKGEAAKCAVIQEDIRYGQKIKSFVVEVREGWHWREIASGTTVGHKRIVRFDEPVDGRIRVRVTDSFGKPQIKSVEIF